MCRGHIIPFPADNDAEGWRKLALEDAMTGLASRTAVDYWVNERFRPEERSYFAVFTDIVNFKPFNDKYGQSAGDRLISSYGHALQAVCRQIGSDFHSGDYVRSDSKVNDLFARFGGDEALLCYDLDGLTMSEFLNAIDSIVERFTNFSVIDDDTKEQVKIRAVFTVSTPNCPRTFEEIRSDLEEQMVALKEYEKSRIFGVVSLRSSECVQLAFPV